MLRLRTEPCTTAQQLLAAWVREMLTLTGKFFHSGPACSCLESFGSKFEDRITNFILIYALVSLFSFRTYNWSPHCRAIAISKHDSNRLIT